MKLREFIETDIYKGAAVISYVDTNGVECDHLADKLDSDILSINTSSGGYVEIQIGG